MGSPPSIGTVAHVPGTALLIALAILCSSGCRVTAADTSAASTGTVPGTVGVDYRNTPDVAALTGYEYVVLSPRAQLEANDLFSRGSRVLYWIQPVVCLWQGKPPPRNEFQGAAYLLAEKHGALLRDSTGALAEIRGSDIQGCYVLDFRNREFAEEMAELVTNRFRGVAGLLFDYGCPDLSWELSLKAVPSSVWDEWAQGYRLYRDLIRERNPEWKLFCQCDRWSGWLPEVCDGLVLEKVGWSLIPYPEAWKRMTQHPSQNILLVEEPKANRVPSRRRLTAALCYLTGGLFAYRDASSGIPLPVRDPEHFELHLGTFEKPYRELEPGVYERRSSNGVVVANLADRPYRYENFTIPPRDALIAQTRDEKSGEPIEWRTTLGR